MQKKNLSPPSAKRTVVLVAMPNARLLDIAGPADVFSLATKVLQETNAGDEGGYEIILASATRSKLYTSGSGIKVQCDVLLTEIDFPVDTILIGGFSLAFSDKLIPGFYSWLKDHYATVRRMGSVCVGAFALAKAGLLDDKNATTHWEYGEILQEEFPSVKVDITPFFVKDDKIYTSGGLTSGIDLAMGLVEEDLGREVAAQVARKLVLHLKRAGNQYQFGNLLPAYEYKSILVRDVREWLMQHLHEEIHVDQMAAQVSMSPRNFARVFLKETNLTPAKFLEKLRIEVARQYLEDTNLSVEQIAEKCGLGNLVSMRRVFLRQLQISPSFYRNAFRTSL